MLKSFRSEIDYVRVAVHPAANGQDTVSTPLVETHPTAHDLLSKMMMSTPSLEVCGLHLSRSGPIKSV